VCSSYFIRHPIILGGIGRRVELDEVHLVKRKYQVGRLVRAQWAFGGYDVETKEGFIFEVENCSRETILPLILAHVRPGSIVTTDCALIYSNLSDFGFRHYTVNHSRNFVDPRTGATTNHVESQWQKIKQIHKQRYGTARTTLTSHLDEWMWRQRFRKSFSIFISHVKELYPITNE
jgi:transposase-like protein